VENYKTVFFGEDSIISTSSNYTLQYIEIPITMKLKTNEIGSLTYYVQIGVEPGWNLSAKGSFEGNTQTTVAEQFILRHSMKTKSTSRKISIILMYL
jgi:hypothetical protein